MTSHHESSVADHDSAEIAKRSYRAYVDKDRSEIERLLDEDFHFTSPLDNRIDRKTYFERCWPNSRWIDGFDFIAVVPSDDRVYVTYVAHSDSGRSFRNTEALTVRDGKIVEVSAGTCRIRPRAPASSRTRRRYDRARRDAKAGTADRESTRAAARVTVSLVV